MLDLLPFFVLFKIHAKSSTVQINLIKLNLLIAAAFFLFQTNRFAFVIPQEPSLFAIYLDSNESKFFALF